ncbi:MAG: hypothetical protein AB1779_03935 [Candidatus Thermoplasmatota archaeon]
MKRILLFMGIGLSIFIFLVLVSIFATAAPKFTIKLKAGEPIQKEAAEQGLYVTFYFIINNTGDVVGDATFDVIILPTTKDWSWTVLCECNGVRSGESKDVSITFFAPPKASADKTYNVTVKVKPPSDMQSESEVKIKIKLPKIGKLFVKAPSPILAQPGTENVQLEFFIFNMGNAKDRYKVESIDISQPGWEFFCDGDNYTGTVDMNGYTTKKIYGDVPGNAPASSVAGLVTIWVIFSSGINQSVQDFNSTCIEVTQIYDIDLIVDNDIETVGAGEVATFTMNISNRGNGVDNVSLEIEFGFGGSWTHVFRPGNIFRLDQINPNARASVDISVPSGTSAGNYGLTIRATSSSPIHLSDYKEVRISVTQVRKISLTTEKNVSTPVAPGEQTEFTLNITNLGNGNDAVNISVISKPQGDWFAELEPKSLTLTPMQKKSVKLIVQPSSNNLESLAGEHKIVVIAYSKANVTVNATLNLTVFVSNIHGALVKITDKDTLSINPKEIIETGKKPTFLISITNIGNVDDTITIYENVSWSSGVRINYRIAPRLITLGPNENKTVSLEITEVSAEIETYYITLWVECSDGSTSKPVKIYLKIVRVDVSIYAVKFDYREIIFYKTSRGKNVVLSGDVFNNGTEPIRDLTVEFYDGNSLIDRAKINVIPPYTICTVSMNWSSREEGEHKIRVVCNVIGDAFSVDNEKAGSIMIEDIKPPKQPIEKIVPVIVFVTVGIVIILALIFSPILIKKITKRKEEAEIYESVYGEATELKDQQLYAKATAIEQERLRAEEKRTEYEKLYGKEEKKEEAIPPSTFTVSERKKQSITRPLEPEKKPEKKKPMIVRELEPEKK